MTKDSAQLDRCFESEANWVACRCQLHSCGATCTKYSFRNKDASKKQTLCRFKAPWKKHEKTGFSDDGLLHIQRNHERVNRYNPALTVALRHNTDVTFLPTCSAGLSMVYYGTNYSTKLETPLWKRVGLMKMVFDGLTENSTELNATIEADNNTAQQKNKTRQFLNRVANSIYTNREVSAVEVCSNLLGYKNSYSSETRWVNIHLSSLYWAVFRRWKGLQNNAGPEAKERASPENLGFDTTGLKLSNLDAYGQRGYLLRNVCFYDYLTTVNVRKCKKEEQATKKNFIPLETDSPSNRLWTQDMLGQSKQRLPVITGYLDNDAKNTLDGYYKR